MPPTSVSLVNLGCARNDIDGEELAGRLAADGWKLTSDARRADVVLVNTCGFIEAAKRDSIDAVLEAAETAAGSGGAVVAVGCLAERYGATLAAELPEAAAVLGFDDYPDISARLRSVLAGEVPPAPQPRDRRLLPVVPSVGHPAGQPGPAGPAYAVTPFRRRLSNGPAAALRLASGCDRRCSFCAIPTFRGAFLSRPPEEVLQEAEWLAERGVRELVLVSENSTAYGKDRADVGLLEKLLPRLAAVPGVLRVRLSYLQPAEMRPSLIEAMTMTPGVVPYFDISFQHAAPQVLRRMRRFGSTDRFLDLLGEIRRRSPLAGVRSNVILGFPGERKADVTELQAFLRAARLDAVGVFGYSREEGTEAADLPGRVAPAAVARRLDAVSRLAEALMSQRAEERVGETVEVLIESVQGEYAEGRAAHQAPEVDGTTTLRCPTGSVAVGDLVRAKVIAADGVDLRAELASAEEVRPPRSARAARREAGEVRPTRCARPEAEAVLPTRSASPQADEAPPPRSARQARREDGEVRPTRSARPEAEAARPTRSARRARPEAQLAPTGELPRFPRASRTPRTVLPGDPVAG